MTSQCVFSILLVLLGLGTVKTRHLHLCPGEVLTLKCDALKNGNIIGDVEWKVNDSLSNQWTTVARCSRSLNCEVLESQADDGINVLGISNGTLTVQRLSPRNATTRSHVNFRCLVDAKNVHSHLVKINLEVECVSTRVGADENLTGHLIDMVRPWKQVKDVKLYSMVGKKLKFASCSSTNCWLSFENIHHPRPAFWKRLKQYDGSILLTRIQVDDDGLVIRVEWNVSPLHHFQSFMLKIRLLQAPQGPDNTSSTFNQSSKIEFMLQDYDTVPMVKTESGKVVGKIETLPLGKSVHTYLGIPYAEPPVGELRFAAPNPAKPWSEIKKAIKYGAACPAQPDFPISHLNRSDAGEENEDCLYLNVFVPSTVKPDVKMAVMVWIHGGAFTLGSSTEYPGHILASFNDVIVVTFNYRLGILGFFNIPGTDFTGNYGMHDQILALKWVQANIASFGGDPNRVTIFGESAGGMSVSLHLISPLSKGLFHRAIMQSGASSSPLFTRKETSPKTLKELKKIANCKLNTGLIQCLRSKSAKEIISFQTTMSSSSPTKLPQITTPVLDGNFLPDQPQKLFKQGKFPNRNIDVIIGFTSHERALSVALKPGNLTQDGISREEFESAVKNALEQGQFTYRYRIVEELIKFQYTDHENPNNKIATKKMMIDFQNDFMSIAPAIFEANALAKAVKHSYLYVFEHRPDFPPFPPRAAGAVNGMDIGFVFGAPFRRVSSRVNLLTPRFSEIEKGFSQYIMKLWTDFAKFGSPTPPGSNTSPITWRPFTEEEQFYLALDVKPRLKQHYRASQVTFWNNLIPEVTRKGKKGKITKKP